MQIRVIGKENCSACEIVKKTFTQHNIEYNYDLLENLNTEEKSEIIKKAREQGFLSMPLILKDGIFVKPQEVIG